MEVNEDDMNNQEDDMNNQEIQYKDEDLFFDAMTTATAFIQADVVDVSMKDVYTKGVAEQHKL